MSPNAELERLASAYGILPGYDDIWGNRREASPETQTALLEAMGVPAATPEQVSEALRQVERLIWQRALPPVQIITQGDTAALPLTLAAERRSAAMRLTIDLEAGDSRLVECAWDRLPVEAGQSIDGTALERRLLTLPSDLPLGYHRLLLEAEGGQFPAMRLIVAPQRCFEPHEALGQRRAWGFAVQLYSLHAGQDWGIGDYEQLRVFAEKTCELGADLVGINPVHALFPADPGHFGPYGPSNRGFLDVHYIDAEALPEFAECDDARAYAADPEVRERLAALRDSPLVDYPAMWQLKQPLLERLFACFRDRHLDRSDSPRGEAFRAYCRQAGDMLEQHVLFEALHEYFFSENPDKWHWRSWPEPLQRPDSAEAQSFAAEHADRLLFYRYLQWTADEQLGVAQKAALDAGMAIGLYRDLAVGVDSGGSMAWAHPETVVYRATAGAPPDEFSPRGQSWGIAPFSPAGLKAAAYEPFIAAVRANVRHAGALRIDHAMGLQRLYWVPEGATADKGCYVSYPLQDLLRIVALESRRNRCVVIGEDLGTVPEDYRPTAQRSGVLSYQVFYFERDEDGAFSRPEEYSPRALVTATTHDLPTLAGFWTGRDLTWRDQLDLFPSAEVSAAAHRTRAQDRVRLLEALAEEGVTGDPSRFEDVPQGLVEAVYRYLSRTPSPLLMVSMEDAFGEAEQPNMPGTASGHPNWQRRLPLPLERLFEDPALRSLAAAVAELRPRGGAAPTAQQTPRPAAQGRGT